MVTLIDQNEKTGLEIQCKWDETKTGATISLVCGPDIDRFYAEAEDFAFLARKFSEYHEKAVAWQEIMKSRRGPQPISMPPPFKKGV